ncbi:hypothetical protein SAMN04488580_102553 [Mycobacterium sp. 283mftsu]|nr:hypothetical protein SAMN04488580_102553 [Mycobacterium sp. 283mftsu]
MGVQRTTRRRAGIVLAAVGLVSVGAGLGAAVAAIVIQQVTEPAAEIAVRSLPERTRTQPGG